MNDRELFSQTLKNEASIFERVLKAVPEDELDWRTHPNSRSAWELITNIFGGEAPTFPVFLKTGKIDFAEADPPEYKTVAEVITAMNDNLNETEKMISKMSDEDWQSKAVMMNEGKSVWETTKGGLAWGLLLDLIHHRGQLSVYLRPMGGTVPSIYGPSGDSPM